MGKRRHEVQADDRELVHQLAEPGAIHAQRPDLIGGVRVWTGETSTVEVNYFTSEAEARGNENKEPPAELAELFSQFADVIANTEFLDLSDPWLY